MLDTKDCAMLLTILEEVPFKGLASARSLVEIAIKLAAMRKKLEEIEKESDDAEQKEVVQK